MGIALALYVLMKIKATEPTAEFILRLQRLRTLPLKLYLEVNPIDIGNLFEWKFRSFRYLVSRRSKKRKFTS